MPCLSLSPIFTLAFFLLLSTTGYSQTGIRADYFSDITLTSPVLRRTESRPYFDYYLESPAPGVNAENFSVRWTGKITAPYSGEYKFIVRCDDGVRLWIDGKQIIDVWWQQEATTHTGSINLKEGKQYALKIEYYNGPLHAIFNLSWEPPDGSGYTFMGFTFFNNRTEIPSHVFSIDPDPVPLAKKEENVVVTSEVKKDAPVDTPVKKTSTTPKKKPAKVEAMIPINESIELKSVEFEQTKSHLQATAHPELNNLAEYLKKHPDMRITIVGHTDYAGDSTANYVLSKERAQAVGNYLTTRGVNAERITVVAMGSAQPKIVHNKMHERTENRRVEFILTDE